MQVKIEEANYRKVLKARRDHQKRLERQMAKKKRKPKH